MTAGVWPVALLSTFVTIDASENVLCLRDDRLRDLQPKQRCMFSLLKLPNSVTREPMVCSAAQVKVSAHGHRTRFRPFSVKILCLSALLTNFFLDLSLHLSVMACPQLLSSAASVMLYTVVAVSPYINHRRRTRKGHFTPSRILERAVRSQDTG